MLLTRSYSQSVANHAKHLPRVYFPFQASTQGQISLNWPWDWPMTKEKSLISEKLRHIIQDLKLLTAYFEFEKHSIFGKVLILGLMHLIFDTTCNEI